MNKIIEEAKQLLKTCHSKTLNDAVSRYESNPSSSSVSNVRAVMRDVQHSMAVSDHCLSLGHNNIY